ncbi:hypothetical protein ACWEOE_33355 [Amycolatopsis sp. NPDC004368]
MQVRTGLTGVRLRLGRGRGQVPQNDPRREINPEKFFIRKKFTGDDGPPAPGRERADVLKFLVDQVAGKPAAGPDAVGLANHRFRAPWNMPERV